MTRLDDLTEFPGAKISIPAKMMVKIKMNTNGLLSFLNK